MVTNLFQSWTTFIYQEILFKAKQDLWSKLKFKKICLTFSSKLEVTTFYLKYKSDKANGRNSMVVRRFFFQSFVFLTKKRLFRVTGSSLISIHYVGEHYVAKLGLGRKSIQELYIYVCFSLNLWSRNIVQGHTTVFWTTLSWEERNMVC